MRSLLILSCCLLFPIQILVGAEGELASLPVQFQADTMLVRFDYAPFLTPDDTLTLAQGEDLVLSCRLELWQKRKFWFDHLKQSSTQHFLLSHDRWEEAYTLTPRGAKGWLETQDFPSLDSLLRTIQVEFPLAMPLQRDDFSRRSYLVYSAEVRYVTPEMLDDIVGWLSGHDNKSSKSLPDKALGFLVNSAGIKNRSYLRSSTEFIPADRPDSVIFSSER